MLIFTQLSEHISPDVGHKAQAGSTGGPIINFSVTISPSAAKQQLHQNRQSRPANQQFQCGELPVGFQTTPASVQILRQAVVPGLCPQRNRHSRVPRHWYRRSQEQHRDSQPSTGSCASSKWTSRHSSDEAPHTGGLKCTSATRG